MKNLVLPAVAVVLLLLIAVPAYCDTWIYLDSTGDLLCVTTLKIPGADIVMGFDACESDTNLAPSGPSGYVHTALTVASALGKAVLKLAALVVHTVV